MIVSTTFASERTYRFDIPRQGLAAALGQFASQSGQPILFHYDMVKDIIVPGLRGLYTVEAGIELLLQGTGLVPEISDDNVLTVHFSQGQPLGNDKREEKISETQLSQLPALVQEEEKADSQDQGASQDRPRLEEIVVTAQRREESLQNVPIAITVLTGGELASSGIVDGDTLPLVTPGLTYTRSESAASPYIRGIGASTTSAGSEGSVATYVDGIYMREMRTLNQAYNNVARVEVLKGPQGTLFGRNATGGLIQIITKTPTWDTEFSAELKAGNNEIFQVDIYGSTGISDTIAADLAISARTQGKGIGKNLTPNGFVYGDEVGFREHTQIRSKWLITPSEKTDVTLTLQWGDSTSDVGYLRVCGEGQICLPTDPHSPNFKDVVGPEATRKQDSETWLSAMHFDHRFENVNFSSITAYQDSEAIASREPYEPVIFQSRINVAQFSETFSQELQLSSSYESELQWITGVFYWDDKSYYDPLDLKTDTGFISVLDSGVNTTSYAVYGQSYYNFTDKTQLTLGTRWTRDKRSNRGEAHVYDQTRRFSGSADFEAWSWRVALSHDFTDNLMGYVSYNRGFKSGGYNSAAVEGRLDPPVDPEFVDTYVIGLKGDFLSNQLRVNAEAYFNKIGDLQLRATDSVTTLARYLNAAAGEMRGLEVTATALLAGNLWLQTGLSLLDAEYTSFPGCTVATQSPDANDGLGGNFIYPLRDCSGNEMINSPHFTFNFVLAHTLPLPFGHLDSTVTYYYNDGYFYGPDNHWGQSKYNVINAVVSWVSENDQYEIGVYGNNITEEKYSSDGYSNDGGNFNAIGIFPREYGLRLKYSL